MLNFPFPTPPEAHAVRDAERLLVMLGALESVRQAKAPAAPAESDRLFAADPSLDVTRITPLGRQMALLPLAPRYARMVVQSRRGDCLPYVVGEPRSRTALLA